ARQLEVGETDRAEIVGRLRMPQCASVQRDGARLVAAHMGDAPVQTPQIRERGAGDVLVAERVRGAAERGAGLGQVVLEEPGFGEQHAQREFVLAAQAGRSQRRLENLRRLGAVAPFERRLRPGEERLEGAADHGGQYTPYTGGGPAVTGAFRSP